MCYCCENLELDKMAADLGRGSHECVKHTFLSLFPPKFPSYTFKTVLHNTAEIIYGGKLGYLDPDTGNAVTQAKVQRSHKSVCRGQKTLIQHWLLDF